MKKNVKDISELNPFPDVPLLFLADIGEEVKISLLKSSRALIYTPSNEHFGIVPVEAMYCNCPVIGVNSGGLKETVTRDKQRGLLCESDPKSFSEALLTLAKLDAKLVLEMGKNGKERVLNLFSLDSMKKQLLTLL